MNHRDNYDLDWCESKGIVQPFFFFFFFLVRRHQMQFFFTCKIRHDQRRGEKNNLTLLLYSCNICY